jgi:hypothetical protein
MCGVCSSFCAGLRFFVLLGDSDRCFGVKWWVLVDVSLLGNRLTTLITSVVVKAVSLNLFVCDVSCRPCQAQPDASRWPWRVNGGQNVQIIRNSVLNWRTPYVVLPSALPRGLIAGKREFVVLAASVGHSCSNTGFIDIFDCTLSVWVAGSILSQAVLF